MTTVKQALESAIEALEYHTEQTRPIQKTIDTITDVKLTLTKIEKCEPVDWKHFDEAYKKACESSQPSDWQTAALYAQQVRNSHTAPQPREWVGLSDSDMFSVQYDLQHSANGFTPLEYARAIEAKLRELNTKV